MPFITDDLEEGLHRVPPSHTAPKSFSQDGRTCRDPKAAVSLSFSQLAVMDAKADLHAKEDITP